MRMPYPLRSCMSSACQGPLTGFRQPGCLDHCASWKGKELPGNAVEQALEARKRSARRHGEGCHASPPQRSERSCEMVHEQRLCSPEALEWRWREAMPASDERRRERESEGTSVVGVTLV